MKTFSLKLILFLLPVAAFFVVACFLADGKTDEYYLKLSSPKQQSLIIGTSRAFQGLQPEVLNDLLKDNYSGLRIFNYAFTLLHSPYGPVYYKAIQQKLDENSRHGLFILTVDPWAVSASHDPNDSSMFEENNTFLNDISMFNGSPNFEYLIKGYEKPWTDIFINKFKGGGKKMLLHNDGWLEVTLPMDSVIVAKRIKNKIESYRKTNFVESKVSNVRMQYLEKTIQLLKPHGDVYLVRLPSHEEIVRMENQLSPEFDIKMNRLAQTYNTAYFSFADSANKYLYTDGNHLHKSSGARISGQLAQLIKKHKNTFDHNNAIVKKWVESLNNKKG